MEVTTKRVALGEIQDPDLNRANIMPTLTQGAFVKPPIKVTEIQRLPVAVARKEPEPETEPEAEAKKEANLTALLKGLTINSPPERLTDIDANQKRNIFLVSEYVNDIYDYLYLVEQQQPIVKDHMAGQKELTPLMRAMLIDWLNAIHLEFRLVPETFQLTVAIIDRYLQVVKDTHRTFFQLVGVTALYIAAKYEEHVPPPIADLVYITDDSYTARQVRQMELQILKAIDCNLSRPLPIHFLRRYTKAANPEEQHHTMSKYFIELAALDYDMASYRPSEIAAASMFLSLNLLNGHHGVGTHQGLNDRHWSLTLAFYSRYSAAHLRPISRQIAKLARDAPQAKLRAIYNKYQLSKFQEIALRTELSGSLMDSIIGLEGPKM